MITLDVEPALSFALFWIITFRAAQASEPCREGLTAYRVEVLEGLLGSCSIPTRGRFAVSLCPSGVGVALLLWPLPRNRQPLLVNGAQLLVVAGGIPDAGS